jgi:ribosome biogenesis GTPase
MPPATTPGRVVRHDGQAITVALPDGEAMLMLQRRLDPEPAVGDWVAVEGNEPISVLPRTSLLRRRAAVSDTEQVMAANIDLLLLVCGLDRPVKAGRIQRGATLAWDAGATPAIVLTKASRVPDADEIAAVVAAEHPNLDLIVTSVKEGRGVPELRELVRGHTVALLGESGAGKSSIMNALLGNEDEATGAVRESDAKGRHTTTTRRLRPLPGGGTLIDTPGIRAVGLWVEDAEAVTATFGDIDELAEECRFVDCGHNGEPGCRVAEAVASGELSAERVAAWRALEREAESAALRAAPQKLRQRDKQQSRVPKEAQRRKGKGPTNR